MSAAILDFEALLLFVYHFTNHHLESFRSLKQVYDVENAY